MLSHWLNFMTVPLLEWMALAVYFLCMPHPARPIRQASVWVLALPAFTLLAVYIDELAYVSRFPINAVLVFALDFIVLFAGTGHSVKSSFYLAEHAYMHTQTMVSFSYALILSDAMRDVEGSTWRPLAILAIGLVLCALVWIIEHYAFRGASIDKVKWHIPIIAFMLVVTGIIVSNNTTSTSLALFTVQNPASFRALRDALYLRTLTLLFADSLICMMQLQFARRLLRYENVNLQSTVRDQQMQYTRSQENLDEIHRLTHDLKHWLMLLDPSHSAKSDDATALAKIDARSTVIERRSTTRLLTDEQRAALLAQLHGSINDSSSIQNSGNAVLDALLFEKQKICARNSIHFVVMADGELLAGMQPLDLTSMVGNLLDNSIEATMKLENEHARIIHFSVSRRKSFVLIHEDNTCVTGRLRFDAQGNLLTTKTHEARMHGHGVRSIKQVAKKYRGTVTSTVDEERQVFNVDIMLPLNAVAGK